MKSSIIHLNEYSFISFFLFFLLLFFVECKPTNQTLKNTIKLNEKN